MKFPEEFKKRVLKAYPGDKQIEYYLNLESESLGLYIDTTAYRGFSADTILAATSLRELKAKAVKQKEREEVYAEFRKLYDVHMKANCRPRDW